MSQNELHEEPEFDFDLLNASLLSWKDAGESRVIFEWNTGPGPTVVYYPYANRSLAQVWKIPVTAAHYSEVYADWLDHKLVPKLINQTKSQGLSVGVRCVDQQPVQVMRMRRREIERTQTSAAA